MENALATEGVKELKYILLTHGHFDHITGAGKLRENYGGKIAVHSLDSRCLTDAGESRAAYFGFDFKEIEPDIILEDGSTLPFGDSEIEVIHTPGHTVGGVCYKISNHLFTGDTLFNMCIGRTDFPGGSMREMLSSMEKLRKIEGSFTVYPGHDRLTTLDYEKTHNPYMKGI